jgi:hypothetical protein
VIVVIDSPSELVYTQPILICLIKASSKPFLRLKIAIDFAIHGHRPLLIVSVEHPPPSTVYL